jgi:uncharacterized membrane protein
MKKFSIFLTILFIFSLNLCLASQYNISISQVGDKLVYHEKISLNSQQEFFLILPDDITGLSASLPYKQEENQITFNAKQIELSYTSKELNKAGNELYFVKKISLPFDSDLFLEFSLDSGYIIDKSEVYPAGKITTDGEHIIVSWNFQNKKQRDVIPIFLTIKSTSPPYLKYILWMTLIIGILALASFFIPKFRRKEPKVIVKKIVKVIERENKKKTNENKNQELERHLLDEERKILEELRKADRNEMWQKQLQLSTNYSKAKLSRLIHNLEARKLVTKIPFGNTNKIVLK